ncbi:MAG TPA: DUF3488 and DUF4129 domain-containing transglutaminase family protein [Terrimicrobiaceae bacterium]|nr:DUF3488 and DUF4129 domain-containing transglutaminase family protein [Terrimicrobiaceae bacterium]
MSPESRNQENISGWLLAAALLLHMVLLQPPGGLVLAASALLLLGAILRGRRSFAPRWLALGLLVVGLAGIIAIRPTTRIEVLPAQLALFAGAVILLRPVTPLRGLIVLCCLLVMLMGMILRRNDSVGVTFVVIDVAVFLILAEQVHRPPEAAVTLWASLLRSIRIVVPVGIVVTLVFRVFPNLSVFSAAAFTGFGGDSVMDPSGISELGQSRRIALVARFAESQEVPSAADLYWRGQVLENNEGLRWVRFASRTGRVRTLRDAAPAAGTPVWTYSQEVTSNRGGIVPVLDHALFVNAKRGEEEIAVLDIGAAVLTAVGAGALTLDVMSSRNPIGDAPEPGIARGAVGLPAAIRESTAMRDIASSVISPTRTTSQNLESLGKYFQDSSFAYSRRPGRIPGVEAFLVKVRRGFCEHYAAAAANLLRLGGIPARVVTGYRGGDWNPWLRTITVRDSDAHAWVEAWDPDAQCWARFDPSAFVAPEINRSVERELNAGAWPWYRRSLRFASAVFVSAGDRVTAFFDRLSASEAWEQAQSVLFGTLLVVASIWLVHGLLQRRRRLQAPSVIERLERRAAAAGKERRPGETPLGWLARLVRESEDPEETAALQSFANIYETCAYRPDNGGKPDIAGLRQAAGRLRGAWNRPPGRPGLKKA